MFALGESVLEGDRVEEGDDVDGGASVGSTRVPSCAAGCDPGSIGPGPATLTIARGRALRMTGTSTARECGLSAGLSMSCFPAALRMKVWGGMSTVVGDEEEKDEG